MTTAKPIYLDYAATTPCDPRVLDAMLPWFTEFFGNAASRSHSYGWQAEEAVAKARQSVAALIGATSKEIIFTSGATESDNLALKGVAKMYAQKGRHIITCQTEHKAILDTAKHLESLNWDGQGGFDVTYLGVDEKGRISMDELREAMREDTILVSIMAANNEIGTIQPIEEIGALCHEKGALFHCDATQGIGKMEIDVEKQHIDLLSLSGHKIYGPKGVGALYVRRRKPRVRLVAQMDGGGHERGMRSGTLNVPGIVGLGEAARLSGEASAAERERIRALRDRLERGLTQRIAGVALNGHARLRLVNTLNVSFANVLGEDLMKRLPDIAVSSASACTSAQMQPSHVLGAMGLTDARIASSVRFSLGRFTSSEEIDYSIDRVAGAVEACRAAAGGDGA